MLYLRLIPLVAAIGLSNTVTFQRLIQAQAPSLAKPGKGVVTTTMGAGGGGMQAGSPWPRFRNNNSDTSLSPNGGCNKQQRWFVYLGSQVFFSSPAVAADGTIYIGTEGGELVAVTSAGVIKWSYQTSGPIWTSPVIGADGTVYIGSNDNSIYAINPNGTMQWSFQTGDQVLSSAAIGSGNCLCGDNEMARLLAGRNRNRCRNRYNRRA